MGEVGQKPPTTMVKENLDDGIEFDNRHVGREGRGSADHHPDDGH